jgi:hypothetical protein
MKDFLFEQLNDLGLDGLIQQFENSGIQQKNNLLAKTFQRLRTEKRVG